MARASLEAEERILDPENRQTLNSVDNLARVLRDRGKKYEEAEEMHRRALAGREKELGENHPYTLTGVYSLAYLYHIQGNTQAAQPLHRQTIVGYGTALCPSHPTTLGCERHFASMQQGSTPRSWLTAFLS
jgi:hypothetical protein